MDQYCFKFSSFLFILVLHFINVNAQEYHYVPFPTSNAVWSEMYWRPFSDEVSHRWVYNQFALFDEDTLINGELYHKLYHTHSSKITPKNSTCIGGIREDSTKSVYCYFFNFSYTMEPFYMYSNEEKKLYDFNVQLGDTIKTLNFLLSSMYLVVKKIDSLIINNTVRKVYSFDPIPWVYWIEGIGNVKGLLFTSGDLPTNGMDNDLICMHHNDTLLYYYPGPDSIYDDCVPTAVLDGVSLLPMNDIKVYPNPVSTGNVCFENLEYDQLELFDTNGRSVATYGITGQTSFMVDVSPLPRGIYNYRLWSKGFIPVCGKLVVK
jgi:hypothetical protein